MSTTFRLACGALALAALAMLAPASAHEGHDHAAPALPFAPDGAARAEAAGDLFEVVAVAKGGELVVHVDRFHTNEPVVGASVEIETPDGPKPAVALDDAYRLPAPWLARPGTHELLVTVASGDAVDVLALTMIVPEPVTSAAVGAGASGLAALAGELRRSVGSRLVERTAGLPTLLVGGIGGFVAGALGVALLRRRRRGAVAAILFLALPMAAASAHEGHDHGDGAAAAPPTLATPQRMPDGALFVPKPTQRILAIRTMLTESAEHPATVELPGRIIPDPNASGFVQAAAGGRLSPPPGGFPRLGTAVAAGDVLAFVTPPLTAAEVSDQRQRQGELDQQIAIAERRIARLEPLDRTRAVARAQLEDARLELAGLRDRRAALDRLRRDPEPLVAPVTGRIAAASAIAGQVVEPNAVIFHIVDPARLWVEALAFAPLPSAPRRATARDGDGRVLDLRHEGTGLADRNQAIAMHLSISQSHQTLRPGQLVSVLVETSEPHRGIAVPRASVVRGGGGQAIVYEHVAAERFEPREVRVVPLDGDRVVLAAGVGRGRRVVTQGAELLNQVR
ncbi:MAG: HlyD family efflux transporter periplasmic adaptor subunit [Alphaproteobacteria bacterium]|nr:HlyD family efflux transporter periplasmic adaptor subunit [Alphaproteobacteria bacterium]